MSGRWPNFLIIGAARSGTSALHYFLGRHPEIFTTERKEPHFFAFVGQQLHFQGPRDDQTINRLAVTDQEAYQQLFAGARHEKAIGESSVSYLYYEQAPLNIRRLAGEIKIIVILRDPVERAFSNFQYMRGTLREPLTNFAQALAEEEKRIARQWHHIWHYRHLGYYARQLARYYREFEERLIHPVLFNEFRSHPRQVLREIFTFLEVDPSVEIRTDMEINISGRPKSRVLAKLAVQSTPFKRALLSVLPNTIRTRVVADLRRRVLVQETIDPRTAVFLRQEYQQDLEHLERLISRDLTAWRTAPSSRSD